MGHKVLLADDSITVQKIVKLSLTEEGIEVIAFGNGEQAVQQLEQIQPDLVMADVFMPGKDGYEVCEFVKSHPQFKHLPVILLVHAFEPFDPERAKKVQADEQLTKPFQSIRTLVTTVQELLAKSQSAAVVEADTATAEALNTIFVAEPQLSLTAPSSQGSQSEGEVAVFSSFSATALATTGLEPVVTPAPELTSVPPPVHFDSLQPVFLSETHLPIPEAEAMASSEMMKTDFMPPLELSVLSPTDWQSGTAAMTEVAEPEFSGSALSAISLAPPVAIDDAAEDILDLSDVLSSDLAMPPTSPGLSATFSPLSEVPFLAVLPPEVAASPLTAEMSAQAPQPISAEDSLAKTFDLGVGQINLDAPLPMTALALEPQAIETGTIAVPSATTTMSISEEAMIEEIVNRVMQRLSSQAIQEIAWEVVPEMAELLIRKQLAKHPPLSH